MEVAGGKESNKEWISSSREGIAGGSNKKNGAVFRVGQDGLTMSLLIYESKESMRKWSMLPA